LISGQADQYADDRTGDIEQQPIARPGWMQPDQHQHYRQCQQRSGDAKPADLAPAQIAFQHDAQDEEID